MDNLTEQNFVKPDIPEEENADFYTDSPKGVIREENNSGGVGGDRAAEAPEDKIQEHRDIAYTDPHVNEGIMTILDWVVGDGYNLSMPNYESAMESGAAGDAADSAQGELGQNESSGNTDFQRVKTLLRQSEFWKVFVDWVRYAAIDGHALLFKNIRPMISVAL